MTDVTSKRTPTIALVGTPNCGKTSLFNRLTGQTLRTGNYPGVTVELQRGQLSDGRQAPILLDLPGTYSLFPYSEEERVTRDLLLQDPPSCILNLLDPLSLERSLTLTLQLLTLNLPMVCAVGFSDETAARGSHLKESELSNLLGVPVFSVSARTGDGIHGLLQSLQSEFHPPQPNLPTGIPQVEELLTEWTEELSTAFLRSHRVPPLPHRFAATCFFAYADGAADSPLTSSVYQPFRAAFSHRLQHCEQQLGADRLQLLAAHRYACAETVVSRVLVPSSRRSSRTDRFTRRLDHLLTGRRTAIPLLILIFLTLFFLTFSLGSRCSDLLEAISDRLILSIVPLLTKSGLHPVLQQLLCEGILPGIACAFSFLPTLLLLFLLLSLLEDSGYLPRAALLLDPPLRHLKLSGQSFLPLLLGFGCTVPAVLATRTLPNDNTRARTVRLLPFLICSAKSPAVLLLLTNLFPSPLWVGLLFCVLYGLSLLLGLCLLRLCRDLRCPPPLLLELPPYRLPSWTGLWHRMREKCRELLRRLFAVLFLSSVVVWFLCSFGSSLRPAAPEESLLALLGRRLEPLFAPLGLDDWRILTALLAGLAAKETVPATLAVLLAGTPAGLSALFDARNAMSFLTFFLLYPPCTAALSAIARERGKKTALRLALGMSALAYGLSFSVYRLTACFLS